jgi:hypothetical protein|tara:strand:+ start:75 stop:260 length:186 start_codon:yes stop_codon:yes gene_type:complete
MNKIKVIGNEHLGIAIINNEDKLLTLSIYPIKLTLELYDNERLQIRLSIFKTQIGFFLEYK